MKDWLWRLAFVAVWVVLLAGGLRLFSQVFGVVCDDCGRYELPGGNFGYSGVFVDWPPTVVWSVLNATIVTGLLVVGSWAFRTTSSHN